MIDDTAGQGENNAAPDNTQTETGERVAFCQQCGKSLTANTVRRAGSAVYCEPCLVSRLEAQNAAPNPATGSAPNPGPAPGPHAPGTSGWTPVNATTQAGTAAQPAGAPAPASNEPSPWLAALLGIIPGVGAAYNGQYAKGLAHLVIFVVLDSLSNNVNGVFNLLVLAWVIYQIVDAYQTAKARRFGTPLPNPFALNDIGDRMGFGRNWPGSASRPVTSATTAGWATAAAAPGSATPPPYGPNWAGYVPPTHFGATATPPPPPPPAQPTAYASAPSGSNWEQVPYSNSNPYTDPWHNPAGAPIPPPNQQQAPPPIPPIPPLPARRFPVGAAWLIAVGLIFLLANLNGSWRLGGSWAVAIVLAALGTFLLFRRIEMVRAWSQVAGSNVAGNHDHNYDLDDYGIASRILCHIRWPIMLLVLALLFALQAAGIRTLGQTWGILLIAFGALLILERTMGRNTWYPTAPIGAATIPPATPPRSASTRKDGQ